MGFKPTTYTIRNNFGSDTRLLRHLFKLNKECQNLGLKEISVKNLKPGMIVYCKKPRWSKSGYGWMFDLSFPKHYDRIRIRKITPTEIKSYIIRGDPGYEIIYNFLNTKKTYDVVISAKAYFWVLESSIKGQ